MPRCLILAGPNGAGKSTAAPHLLQSVHGIDEFVNADVLARGLAGRGQPSQSVAIRAGRIMIERLDELAAQGVDFAFETNLASRSWIQFIKRLRGRGYIVELLFFALPTPEAALARVAARVREGGHHVEEEIVRRRFDSGRRLFFERYRDLVDRWKVFDGQALRPTLLAEGGADQTTLVHDEAAWKTFTP